MRIKARLSTGGGGEKRETNVKIRLEPQRKRGEMKKISNE